MSVDTKKCRDFYSGRTVHSDVKADIYELCQEIDRLRKDVEAERQCSLLWRDESNKFSNELAKLGEQMRPRSIKDEPPQPRKAVLAHSPNSGWQFLSFSSDADISDVVANGYFSHWLPMPPAPPQPDAFEEWAEAQAWWQEFGDLSRAYVRDAWNAAIQSTKSHEKTNPVD